MKKSKKQMSETYFIGSLLAVVGGYLEAYTYISRGGVFANAQTGNVVLLGISFAEGNIIKALTYLVPIIAFVLGILVCEKIRELRSPKRIHWRQYVIMLEIAVLVLVAFLPGESENEYVYNMIANVLISFVCSLQVQSFRKIRGIICATTMCTGNLRSATECLIHYGSTKNTDLLHKAGKYYGIVLFFMIGGILGVLLTNIFFERSVLFGCIGLLIAVMVMFIEPADDTDKK